MPHLWATHGRDATELQAIIGHPVHAQMPHACPLKLTIARTDLLRQWRVRCSAIFRRQKNRPARASAGKRRRYGTMAA